ncbi:carnitine acetyl transferase [Favolaschia claudopus]|uniref:Carnitine acetyl transferase n=1 Tax=Favolaschia claudopus TaxID=2862362 RepID=A0AAW0DDA2_9AGAR
MLRLTSRLARRSLTMPPSRKSSTEVPPKGYIVDPSAGPMLRFQASLPRLPVPTISSTAHKYLETVRPHLNPAEYAQTEASVHAFMASPQAAELQKRLEARAAEPGMLNWLSEWWNDAAYMAYFYVHADDRLRTKPAQRAAALLKAMLPFRQMTETKELEPEKVRGAPLCMDSYKWLPPIPPRKFDPATHNHVVFVRKNKFFSVPLVHSSGQELSAAELETCPGDSYGTPVGVLTSDNRDNWTDAREVLAADPANAASLEAIESAMIVVCLDDTKPVTREEMSTACWVIVFDNGRSGFLGEHSCMDGTPTLRMNEFPTLGAPTNETLPSPTELAFNLNPTTRDLIKGAESRFDALVAAHELHVLHYEGYGKEVAKGFGASPDAWAQLAAQTRKYQLGRTEVIRSASNESKAWAEAMLDPAESDGEAGCAVQESCDEASAVRCVGGGRAGCGPAFIRVEEDGEGWGGVACDLFGWGVRETGHWELSTSQLSSPYLEGWGYGEVVPDGYGLSYAIGERYIRWTITSTRGDAAQLRHYLAEAATELRDMMERAAKEEKKEMSMEGKAKL